MTDPKERKLVIELKKKCDEEPGRIHYIKDRRIHSREKDTGDGVSGKNIYI